MRESGREGNGKVQESERDTGANQSYIKKSVRERERKVFVRERERFNNCLRSRNKGRTKN